MPSNALDSHMESHKADYATKPTDDHKRNILANNYARVHGIDIEATKIAIANDPFSQARRNNPRPVAWSTTSVWPEIVRQRAAERGAVISA